MLWPSSILSEEAENRDWDQAFVFSSLPVPRSRPRTPPFNTSAKIVTEKKRVDGDGEGLGEEEEGGKGVEKEKKLFVPEVKSLRREGETKGMDRVAWKVK